MQHKTYTVDIGGKTLTAEFTDLADQANGSVILRSGNTAVLATAVMSSAVKEGLDYFPLTVEYEERFYAAGSILGSRFVRREGRPTDEAVLSGRVIDRTIRPLFEGHIRNEVQVIVTVLSIDEDDPDILGINAASLALLTSDIPWKGPVSAVRVGKSNGSKDFEINPSYTYRKDATAELDMIVCGKDGLINMIEAGALECTEETAEGALSAALVEIERLQEFQNKIASEIGKEKRQIPNVPVPESVPALFESAVSSEFRNAVFSGAGKGNIHALKEKWTTLADAKLPPEEARFAADFFEDKVDELIHQEAVQNKKRPDGRALDELRPLYAKAGGISPIIHGSGIFYRGGTHVFSTVTLGGPEDSLLIDSIEESQFKKRFIHHYNFPPFSVGETGRVGGMNRRMIGHGALAERALTAIIPPKESFPYTIRIVSECMASNGSTSMGSVCASTLALMDAGVPIRKPVAGIAMGLMMEDAERYAVLTDIQGPEDHHGDMDFKAAGTRDGITAIQMDVKVAGIPIPILSEALREAKRARQTILDVIEKEISAPRPDISPRAPKILTITIKKSQIGLLIGPGGKTINSIREETGVEDITIEEDGTVFVTGKNGTAELAKEKIIELTREYLPGDRFEGEVTRILDFGAFVRIGRNTEGLVHVSEMAPFRVEKVSALLSVGQRVPVIIKEIDEKERINLSIKNADPEFFKDKSTQ